MKQLKVLFFLDRLLFGGIQALVLDILRHNNCERMKIDILTLDDGKKYPLEQELMNIGVKIYRLHSIWLSSPRSFTAYKKAVDDFFCNHHHYDVVHVHSGPKNYYLLKIAKKWGIPVRASHAHSTSIQNHSFFNNILSFFVKKLNSLYANLHIGCSLEACKWLFGNDAKDAHVLLNAIDFQPFLFNKTVRDSLRSQLQIDNKFVLGHVGRFSEPKNHSFLLDILYQIVKKCPDSVLLLVGQGELESEIINKIRILGLEKHVMLLGFKTNRYDYLQAMDAFVFPSLFEGLGIVLVEAQACDLQVFSSDVVPTSVKYTDKLHFLSLDLTPEQWADKILSNDCSSRQNIVNLVKKSCFDIETYIDNLYSLYIQTLNLSE